MRADIFELWHTIYYIDRQTKTINLVIDRQFQRCVDITLLLVTAHMQIFVIGSAIGETVNQPRITVEVENDWLISGEQRIKIAIA